MENKKFPSAHQKTKPFEATCKSSLGFIILKYMACIKVDDLIEYRTREINSVAQCTASLAK